MKSFLIGLISTALLSVISSFFLIQRLDLQRFGTFYGVSIGVFVAFCIVLYYFSQRAKKGDKTNQFTNIFFSFTFLKMLLAIVLVTVFFYQLRPDNNLFILPFFLIYFIYTVFEVWFMTRLAQSKQALGG